MNAAARFAAALGIALVLGPAALLSAPVQATAAGDGSSTVLVLDISGSMSDPAQIPADFPKAAELKSREDAVGRLVEQAHPGQKVPLDVIAGGLFGLPDLLQLQSQLDDYLQQRNIDPASLSKLTALKRAAGTVLTALQFERDHAGVDDRVGVVTFGTDASVLSPVTPSIAGLAPAIQGLTTDGSTNVGAGVQSALDLLKDQPNPSIILLTDGWNNEGMTNDQVLSGPVQQAAAGKVPICTVGIGQSPADVDQQLLLDMANRTGGGYHFVSGGDALDGDLLACHQSLGGQWLADQRGTAKQGQTTTATPVIVPAGRHRLTVTLTWPGSQMDLRLTDPTGKTVGTGYPGAAIGRSGGLVVATITNPAAGRWMLSVAGLQTAAAGEPYVATASADGTTPNPPRDVLVGSGAAPLDTLQRQLQIAEYVSAAVVAVCLVLWIVRAIVRLIVRIARRGRSGTTFVTPGGASGTAPGGPGGTTPFVPSTAGATGYVPGAGGQAGYAPTGYGQPGYAPGGFQSVSGTTPPYQRSQRGGCLGCLIGAGFWLGLIVLGASALSLYLWTTPLLTFPG